MRRVSERDLDAWLARVAPSAEADPVGHLALVHAHPEWMVRAFAEALGGDPGQWTGLAELAPRSRPTTNGRWCICARGPAGSTRPNWPAEVGGLVGAYSPYAVYLPEGAPGEIEAVAHGRAHVQDEGSQLVAVGLARGGGSGT